MGGKLALGYRTGGEATKKKRKKKRSTMTKKKDRLAEGTELSGDTCSYKAKRGGVLSLRQLKNLKGASAETKNQVKVGTSEEK